MKRKIYLVICLILALVFVGSSIGVGITLHRYKQADSAYSNLQSRYIVTPQEKPTAPIDVNFNELLEQNGDISGWLYCENTPINYPVVQAKDNDYYLHRDLNGNNFYSGTLFVDYRCSAVDIGQNYIIYGHNMKNGRTCRRTQNRIVRRANRTNRC